MAKVKKSPIATLKSQAKEFDFSKLRAAEDNKGANSGKTMYLDFPRMNFVINGKSIDKILTSESIEGYKKQYAWKVHLQELPTLKDRSKTFYSNQDYDHLFSEKGDGNKHYRPFAKEVFKQIFGYAGAAVPNDSILEELTTHCNQSGYVGSLLGDESKPLTKISFEHGLNFQSIDYTIYS